MNNLEVYEIIKPYVGTEVTLVLTGKQKKKKEGILATNLQHTHITLLGNSSCAYVPLNEQAGLIDSIRDKEDVTIYKNNNVKFKNLKK